MNPLPSPPTSLIGKCLRRSGPKQRGKILESYAAEVVIACRILGPNAAGKSLGEELFGEQGAVTATPILKVVSMVESAEIPVSREQLLAVVQQDESAMRFYESNPWIVDPTGQSAPPTKKGRKPRIQEVPEQPSPPKKVKPATPKAKTVALPPTEVVEPAEPAAEIPEEEIEGSGDKPRKRTTVKMPPEYSPEDYVQKPRPALTRDCIQGGPATGAD